jgi:DNA polymerase I-like protein with 3'-5' exonuclease and polymerase domains
MNPKKGKWLVELDYGSEETFVQACICKDSAYNEIYNSKDIYLAFANKMRLVPDDDWNNLPKAELKEKYHEVRSSIKSLVLGLSYGMGAKKLSQRLGLTMAQAECYVEQVNRILGKSTKYKGLLRDRIQRCKSFSLPDGFICKGADKVVDNNATTIINFPFQSGGGMILRVLVHFLTKAINEGKVKAKLLATIHDAIFFEVDEGDMQTIQQVSEMMREMANKVLAAPEGWSIKVGSPEIIKQGEVWTPDHNFDAQFKDLLNFDG